jgi:SagB-type dehydrogenase family enzyme
VNDPGHATPRTQLVAALAEAHRVRPVAASGTPGHPPPHAGKLWQDDGTPVPVTDIGPTSPFAATIARRHSTRLLGPPSLSQVGLVVARSGLTRRSAHDAAGVPVAQRAAPSAGARHPLTLVVLARDVPGLPRGGWALDPDAAVLRRSVHAPDASDHALAQIGDALRIPDPPPAAIVAVADPHATLSRYPDGISLLWREAGALLMLVHLAATDIGLGSCLAGTCAVLHPVTNDPSAPADLGAVALGTIANPEDIR